MRSSGNLITIRNKLIRDLATNHELDFCINRITNSDILILVYHNDGIDSEVLKKTVNIVNIIDCIHSRNYF